MPDTTPPALPHIEPVEPQDRLIWLDVLRSIALLGILLVNIHEFRSPELFAGIVGIKPWTGSWDLNSLTTFLSLTFFSGKWVLIYSFLFGIGIQLMCTRLAAKGASAAKIVSRRLGILLLFGLFHVLFFWFGDILIMYSLLGFGVLLMYRTAAKFNLLLAGILLSGIFLVYLLLGGLATLGEVIEPGSSSYDESDWLYQHYQNCLVTYAEGSWFQIVKIRLLDTLMCWGFSLLWAPQSLALMLLGAWTVKSGHFQNPSGTRTFRTVLYIISIPAFLLSGLFGLLSIGVIQEPALEYMITLPGSLIIFPVISLTYCVLIIRLVQHTQKHALWSWFSAAGRMPLTNYLAQSAIATTLFYGYGLGWYGNMDALPAVGVALLIYASQLLVSHWWMSRHRYGPLEKLWRKLSYGRI